MGKEYRKTVLFGLHKKSVDRFLKKLHHLQQVELLELKEEIKQAQERDDLVKNELKQLRDRELQKEPVKPSLKVISFKNVAIENSVVKFPSKSQRNELDKAQEEHPAPEQQLAQAMEEAERDDSKSPNENTHMEVEPNEELIDTAHKDKEVDPSLELGDTQPQPSSVSNSFVRNQAMKRTDSFWGDIEDFLDEDVPISSVLTPLSPRVTNPSESIEENITYSSSSNVEETAASLQEEETGSHTEEEGAAVEENEEIEKIKRNYIVGKLAGENLLDSRGRLIVAKDAVIHEDTIKKAQQEGKLAELIVNMVLPRMDE